MPFTTKTIESPSTTQKQLPYLCKQNFESQLNLQRMFMHVMTKIVSIKTVFEYNSA
jgi:hypothetical protein